MRGCSKGFAIYGIVAACFLILTSCGYRWDQENVGLPSQYSTISVPYVKGDLDGLLTAAIIKEVVRSGLFDYMYYGGSLILNVELIDIEEDNIGFRYDRKKRGTLTKDVIPTEERITIYVDIWITEAATCKNVLGPVRLSASVDYDHDYYSSRDGINIFSLGQLSDLEAAYDAVQVPLRREIAKKVIDYVSQSW